MHQCEVGPVNNHKRCLRESIKNMKHARQAPRAKHSKQTEKKRKKKKKKAAAGRRKILALSVVCGKILSFMAFKFAPILKLAALYFARITSANLNATYFMAVKFLGPTVDQMKSVTITRASWRAGAGC